MFGRKKRIRQAKAFLNDVDEALADKTITSRKRKLLAEAKKRMKQGKYFPRVLTNLEGGLRPMALRLELSKSVSKVYQGIINSAYQDQSWSGMMFK